MNEKATDPPRSDPAGGAASADRRRNPIRRRDIELDRMDLELNVSPDLQNLLDATRMYSQGMYRSLK